MKNILRIVFITFYSLSQQNGFAQFASNGNQKPNIVFIISDDHAYQAISAYGSTIAQTPNIDRIAKTGARFANSFVTNSLCGPSRATLITGKYSHLNHYKANEGKFEPDQVTFPAVLQANNYQTAWVGKWHLGTLPRGFDFFQILRGQGQYFNPDFINTNNDTSMHEGYVTDVITKLSVDWLDHRDKTKPFCIVIGEKATHRNWLPDVRDLGAYDNQKFKMPGNFKDTYEGRKAAQVQAMEIGRDMRVKEDLKVHMNYNNPAFKRMTPAQRKAYIDYYEKRISKEFDQQQLKGDALVDWKFQRFMKDYLSTAKSLDRNIGKILDYLDSTGLSKNTVVIYVSDQGFYLGEHGWFDKRYIYEESLRTPFLMRYPGVTEAGSVINNYAVNIDWAPTLLDIAGAKKPDEMQGVSLVPIIKNDKEIWDWKNRVYYHYYEYPQAHHAIPHFGIKTENFKLIRFYGEINSWELFDLKKDADEMHNVIDDPQYATKKMELVKQLKDLAEQYKDEEAVQIINANPTR